MRYGRWQAKAAFAVSCALFSLSVVGQDARKAVAYPSKPIRFLVSNQAGGGVDITARTISKHLTDRWGQSVVVDNRAGASGVIAMDLTAHALPDGYTILAIAGAQLGSAAAQKKVGYDVRSAYAPITQLTSQYYLLLVTPAIKLGTLKEVLAYAKGKPGQLTFGSAGMGSMGHAGLEIMKSMAGVDITHVPYKGIGPALIDMIGGQLHLAFVSTISSTQHVKAGRLKALAVTTLKRAQAYPELPTMAESGLPGFDLNNWYGLLAPKGTPEPIITALHQAVDQILKRPDVQALFVNDGAEAAASESPKQFGVMLGNEVAKWEGLIRMPGFAANLR